MASSLSAFLQQTPLRLSVLLQCAQQSQLVADAQGLIRDLPDSLLDEARELLPGLCKSALVLVMAHCITRRGRGGPAAKPNPLQDGCQDMAAAMRKAANRRAAALSKLRSKLAATAGKLLSADLDKPGPSSARAATARPFKLRLNSSLPGVVKQPMKRPAAIPHSSSSSSSSALLQPSCQLAYSTGRQQQGSFNLQPPLQNSCGGTGQAMHPWLSLAGQQGSSGTTCPAAAATAAQGAAVITSSLRASSSMAPTHLYALPAVLAGGAVAPLPARSLQQQPLLGIPRPADGCVQPHMTAAPAGTVVTLPGSSAAAAAQPWDAMLQQVPGTAGAAVADGDSLDFGVLCASLGITD